MSPRTFHLFPLIILLLLFHPLSPSAVNLPRQIRVGLTGESCTSDADCIAPRGCFSESGLFECRSGETCVCFLEQPELCTPSTVCPDGESCASKNGEPPLCIADAVISSNPEFEPSEGTTDGGDSGDFPMLDQPTPPPTPSPSAMLASSVPPPPSPSPPGSTSPPPESTSPPPNPTSPPPEPTSPPPNPTSPPPEPTSPPPDPTPPSPDPAPPSAAPPASTPPTPAPVPPSPDISPVASASSIVEPSSPSPTPPAPASPPSETPAPASSALASPQPTVTPSPVAVSSGLAGDLCTTTDDCLNYRRCLDENTFGECQVNRTCRCLGSRVCTCNDDCTDGELCSGVPDKAFCFSPGFLDSLPWATDLPCSEEATTSVTLGLTGDVCRNNDNCLSPRVCRAGGGENCALNDILCESTEIACSTADEVCYCYALATCNCSDDCEDSEVCTEIPSGRLCVSEELLKQSGWLNEIGCNGGSDGPDVVELPAPFSPEATTAGEVVVVEVTPSSGSEDGGGDNSSEDPVCVDAEALEGMEVVFERDVKAGVLCDEFGSCATEGHIVAYKGIAMMMKSYCEIVGCVRKVLLVNSPVRRRGLRVKSRTEGLEYTAFAARFGTRVEELILTTAVRIGM